MSDRSGFLERVIAALNDAGVQYCVIGGTGVNAFADPVVTLDLDVAVATADLARATAVLGRDFRVREFEHSLNVYDPDSALQVQVQLHPRYGRFPGSANEQEVLGLRLPVARPEDLLKGKIWAYSDSAPWASKRQKDLADIARLLEAFPDLRAQVPDAVLSRLVE
ncbi:MAG: hypothetical protein ACSLFM_10790 [Tepidiformaceae bacterium]